MYILGINAFHGDSSACLLKDGRVICASEEERFRRIKHWAGFPSQAIKFCLEDAGISIDDVDYVTISRNPNIKNATWTSEGKSEISSGILLGSGSCPSCSHIDKYLSMSMD